MDKITTTKAARALVAYYSSEMADRLVRRVLKEKSPEAWQRLADAILAQIPKAVGDKTWPRVLAFVDAKAVEYVASEAFGKAVFKTIQASGEKWTMEAVARTLEERTKSAVHRTLNERETDRYVRDLPVKFRGMVDAELAAVARQKAAEVAGASK